MSLSLLIEENEKKLDIETKNLSVLKDMSQRCNNNTQSIRTILSEFDNRLARLEKLIHPVYKETGNLQSKQTNLFTTLEKLNYVIQFYSVTSEVEIIIRSGPANQLDSYMQCLDRLEQAIHYFSRNNQESPEYLNVKSLFEYGSNAMEREFKQVLQRLSSPIAPIALLDVINDSNEYVSSTFEKLEGLGKMSKWLCQRECNKFVSIYTDLRSEFLYKSMKSFLDYHKSTSLGHGASLGLKKNQKSIQMAFKRRFIQNVMPSDDRSSLDEVSISDRETDSYVTCTLGFLKLAAKEQDLIASIVPSNVRIPIFNELIQSSLNLICTEANDLTTRVKKAVAKKDFKSSLSLFPLLRHQIMRRHQFDSLFAECHSTVLSRFLGLIVTFQNTIYVALSQFSDFVKSDTDMKVPDDGTVHELTNNVLIFIDQLSEYLDLISNVIPITEPQPAESTADKNKFGFAQYVAKLLAHLGVTLQKKSESYLPNNELVYLFKFNNYHYILKRLRDSNLIEIIHLYNDRAEEIYVSLINEVRQEYFDRVDQIAATLPYVHESENKTRLIKDGFTSFNTKFGEFHRNNRRYAVPDPQMKLELRQECIRLILPRYTSYYEKFSNGELIKNKEKYIKYNPSSLKQMINNLFE